MAEKNEFEKRPVLSVMARSVAWVAALFCLVVSILLVADFVRVQQMDPLNDPYLLKLRTQLAESTGDTSALVEQIRVIELHARSTFFRTQGQRTAGGVLLLGGAVVCFLGFKLGNRWNPKLPDPKQIENIDHWEFNALFRQLMAGAGIFLVVLSLFLALVTRSDLAEELRQAGMPSPHVAQAPLPAQSVGLPESFKQNWPSLRGAGGLGVAHFPTAPTQWDVESGEGILWKVEIPVHGFNSPIVWGDKVFLSGGDEEGLEVFCFAADSGELLWSAKVASEVEPPELSEDTGFAASTMATDGTRVFAIFATGDLAAFDFEGKLVWQKNLGVPENPYGMGSSLISDGVRLFVQYDHEENQKVMAFDTTTGKLVWEKARFHISWSTPALVETTSGLQLILNDEEFVTAYNPETGAQLWQVKCLGGEVAPSPAFSGGIVFVANEYAQASALKLTDGQPEILWQYDDKLPEIASPLASKKYVYIPTTSGDVACLNAQSGEELWTQEFDEGFNSSPVLVGDRIYVADIAGVVHIFKDCATFELIAQVNMGEAIYGTPAFMDGRLYIRGDEFLYCIGK